MLPYIEYLDSQEDTSFDCEPMFMVLLGLHGIIFLVHERKSDAQHACKITLETLARLKFTIMYVSQGVSNWPR